MAIETARKGWAAALLKGEIPRDMPPEIVKRAQRRLSDLGDARSLDDLRAPGLRLHALRGDLAGWWSVAIDRRWRLIFRWIDDAAHDVDIVDYH